MLTRAQWQTCKRTIVDRYATPSNRRGVLQFLTVIVPIALLWVAFTVQVFLSIRRVYRQGWIKTSIKFVAISGIYLVFFLIPAIGAVFFLSAFGGSFG